MPAAALLHVRGIAAADVVKPVEEDRRAPKIPDTEEVAVKEALESSKELKRLDSNYREGAGNQRRQSATPAARGSDRAVCAAGQIQQLQRVFPEVQANNAELGVSVQIPVFVGSGVKALIKQAETDQQHIHSEVDAERNRIALDIHQSYLDIRKADVARELAQADLDLARTQLSVLLAQMSEGRASLRQVEEARFSEDEKWTAFYDAQFSAERARLNVLRQTGELRAALQ